MGYETESIKIKTISPWIIQFSPPLFPIKLHEIKAHFDNINDW